MDPTPIIQKGAEYGAKVAFDKAKEWVGLVIDYNQNLKNAKDSRNHLGKKLKEVQEIVELGERSNEVVLHDVQKWQDDVKEFLHPSSDENDKDWDELLINEELRKKADSCCFGLGCNPKHRHHVSRVAKEKIDAIKDFNSQINAFGLNLTRRSLPPQLQIDPDAFCAGLKSRERKADEIMAALKDEKVNRIGVFGMGGAGKTTLVEEIARRSQSEKLFNVIVKVEISEDPNIKQIQDHIADRIGLRGLNYLQAVEERSLRLNESLMNLKRKKSNGPEGQEKGGKLLIILDNLWDKLELHLVGIRFELEHDTGCKIIVTSRIKDVCKVMGAKEYMFEIGDLDHDEAKQLFKAKVGPDVFELDEYKAYASTLLELCPRLPLSINILANVLKDQPSYMWRNVIEELEKPMIGNIGGGVLHKTYSIIEMSYKKIRDEDEKQFFLLCCLYPPGSSIKIENLLRCGVGLSLFQYVTSLTEAIKRAYKWADHLRSISLLLDVDIDTGDITIHDDVREAAKFFKTEGKLTFYAGPLVQWLRMETCEKYNAISVPTNGNCECLSGLHLPRLQLLRVVGTKLSRLCDDYFSRMQNVKVLDLSNMDFGALPKSMECLANLETLLLENCYVKDISHICKLTNLQVISLKGCNLLKKLPGEMSSLVKLKVLDLTDCRNLKEIPAHMLEKLAQLEGLYMMNSFTNWQLKGSMASLLELKYLTLLKVLEVAIESVDQLHEGEFPNPDIASFKIIYGSKLSLKEGVGLSYFERDWLLSKTGSSPLTPSWDMQVEGLVASDLIKKGWKDISNKVKSLYLKGCVYNLGQNAQGSLVYFNLQVLKLEGLKGIEYGLPAEWGKMLRVLTVLDCEDLKYVFSTNYVSGIEGSSEDGDEKIRFPCLVYLIMKRLPSLQGFCGYSKNTDGVQLQNMTCTSLFTNTVMFPCLEKLMLVSIKDIEKVWDIRKKEDFMEAYPKLKFLYISQMKRLKHIWDVELVNLYLPNLEELKISQCSSIEYVLPHSLAINGLPQLKELEIAFCDAMKHVIMLSADSIFTECDHGDDEDEISATPNYVDETSTVICFPRLLTMTLYELGSLTCFYKGRLNMEFPALKNLGISYLRNLETFGKPIDKSGGCIWAKELFSGGKVFLPSLEELYISRLNKIYTIWDIKVASEEEGRFDNRFSMLKHLTIDSMPKLGSVWKHNKVKTSENGWIQAPSLAELNLSYLPMLEGLVDIGKDRDSYDVDVDVIKELTCERDLSITRTGLLFNDNVSLPSLKCLEVNHVDKIKTIWDLASSHDDENEEEFAMMFPKLEKLNIRWMPKLSNIWTGANTHSIGKYAQAPLRILKLGGLPKFKGIVPTSRCYDGSVKRDDENLSCYKALFSGELPEFLSSLEELLVKDVENIELIWDMPASKEGEIAVKFSKFKELRVRRMPKLRHIWNVWFKSNAGSLRLLEISNCNVMKSLVGRQLPIIGPVFNQKLQRPQMTSLFHGQVRFCSLETLKIENMPIFEEIFDTSTNDVTSNDISFPRLITLALIKCPELKGGHHFWHLSEKLISFRFEGFTGVVNLFSLAPSDDGDVIDFKSTDGFFVLESLSTLKCLQELTVGDCGSLEMLFRVRSSPINDEHTLLPSLKTLKLSRVSKLKHIPFHMFPSLQSFEITDCHFGQSNFLISANGVIKGLMLQKLETLSIADCDGLEAIIAEEQIFKEDHEFVDTSNCDVLQACPGETTSNGGHIIKLPSIKTVKWDVLPSLKAFSSTNYKLSTPLLESVDISIPFSLESFSLGDLVAPKLTTLVLDGKKIEDDRDLYLILPGLIKDKRKAFKKWPKMLKHVLHKEHYLKLTAARWYWCGKCRHGDKGLSFSCLTCGFKVHPTCALENFETQLLEEPNELKVAKEWPRELQHERHNDHPLQLTMGKEYTCKACDEEGLHHFLSFSCNDCDFDLHPKCALDKSLLPIELEEEEDGEKASSSIPLVNPEVQLLTLKEDVPSPSTASFTYLATRTPLFIGGKFFVSQSTRFVDVLNLATQEIVTQVPLATNEEFKAAVSAANEALPAWRDTPISARQSVMLKFDELIHRDIM